MIRYASSSVWELPMPTTFRAYQPDQPLLLPPDLQEWVPPGHLAHHVSDVVDALDLTAFYAPYEGDGRRNAPYEPSMMVKVLIYAYATGTFSSRAVARKLEEDVAFRMLAAGNFPQHRTVCEFRRRHLAAFSELFVGVVQVCARDGTGAVRQALGRRDEGAHSNASKRKAMSYERMGKEAARLQAEIEALLTKAGRWWTPKKTSVGARICGATSCPRSCNAGRSAWRRSRQPKRVWRRRNAGATMSAGARPDVQDRNPRGGRPYKRAYGEPEPKAQSNFTDPESQNIMKTSSEGFQQCYNAQMAVDGEHQIIVATQVGPQASDQGQLVGMLDEINETFGVEPAVVLADAGYCNEPDLLELEDRGIDAHVALGREGKSQVAVDPARLPATHRMGEKLASPAGKARYAQRKWLSEAPNGWIKEVLGFRRFSLRGLAKVRGEWDLVCLALNIKRMGTVATC